MNQFWDDYRKLEHLAYTEWHDALKSGAPDDKVQKAHDLWQDVVQLIRRTQQWTVNSRA